MDGFRNLSECTYGKRDIVGCRGHFRISNTDYESLLDVEAISGFRVGNPKKYNRVSKS